MDLPLTSLIPTVIELTRFWETSWPQISWYPYWYLGVPYRFLTGPVVPVLIIFLGRLSNLSLLGVYLGMIAGMWAVGAIGIYYLGRSLGGEKRTARLAGLFFMFLPISMWLLQFGNGLAHFAFGLLPWLFYFTNKNFSLWRVLSLGSPKAIPPGSNTGAPSLGPPAFAPPAVVILILSLILLINPATMLAAVIGMLVLALLTEQKNWDKNLLRLFFICLTAFGIATIWYTPAYWLTVLFNPSLGGKSLVKVIGFVGQLLFALLPLIFGLWTVQKRYRLRSKLNQFALFFGGFFVFLSLIRMISDIDFWMDWTAYFLEIQISLAILIPALIKNTRYITKQFVILLIFLIMTITDVWLIGKLINNPNANTYKQEIIQQISAVEQKDVRWFFSGSPVFWLGSNYEQRVLSLGSPKAIPPGSNTGAPSLGPPAFAPPVYGLLQVRGGKDQAASNPVWADGAYQIREGQPTPLPAGQANPQVLLRLWLQVFGVKYVLVPEAESREPFRDFKNLDRFAAFKLVSDRGGNLLFETGYSWARVADKAILQAEKPKSGNDARSLNSYTKHYKSQIEAKLVEASEIVLEAPDLAEDEVISLSVTYDPGWQIEGGQVTRDRWGQLVLLPDKNLPELILKYRQNRWASLGGLVIAVVGCIGLKYAGILAQRVADRLDISKIEDDEQEKY